MRKCTAVELKLFGLVIYDKQVLDPLILKTQKQQKTKIKCQLFYSQQFLQLQQKNKKVYFTYSENVLVKSSLNQNSVRNKNKQKGMTHSDCNIHGGQCKLHITIYFAKNQLINIEFARTCLDFLRVY